MQLFTSVSKYKHLTIHTAAHHHESLLQVLYDTDRHSFEVALM